MIDMMFFKNEHGRKFVKLMQKYQPMLLTPVERFVGIKYFENGNFMKINRKTLQALEERELVYTETFNLLKEESLEVYSNIYPR